MSLPLFPSRSSSSATLAAAPTSTTATGPGLAPDCLQLDPHHSIVAAKAASSSSSSSLWEPLQDLAIDADAAAATGPQPPPATLADLVARLHAALATAGIDTMGSVDVAAVQALMESYVSNADDWRRFAHFDSGRYTRNLVDAGNDKFNLMVLCWAEDQASAIHDHSGAHCLMKILDGELVETRYEWPEGDGADQRMMPTLETTLQRDQVAYVHDSIGLHRVSNRSKTQKAVSLHLYCPPFETCQTFNERTGECRGAGKTVFFSIDGVRCRPNGSK
ncbi:RmlC-like cupin domain-containing protein [Zopfochytrium polystomum]|nr:RmlC-like cupin domain-containing protein [Zopfochytrium polystomum]